MAKTKSLTDKKIIAFYNLIKGQYPIKKIFLFGSYASGKYNKYSDIDVGVVINLPYTINKIKITRKLWEIAHQIDINLEPKCILWNEYKNHAKASILADIIRSRKDII